MHKIAQCETEFIPCIIICLMQDLFIQKLYEYNLTPHSDRVMNGRKNLLIS